MLYWDFLMRHEKLLEKNQRMTMQLKNLCWINVSTKQALKEASDPHRKGNSPSIA